jgi:predicted TIM-barrel fold metal-dependent hydrolase
VALQVREILTGIRDYRLARPGGLLEIRPFLGINTRNHDPASLASLLEGAFGGYRRGEAAASKAFLDMAAFDLSAPTTPDLCFAGVKVYPPLGFDPWPDEDGERQKVQLLYSFCEARGIPMITHCDDQGFRVIGLEDSWAWAAPSRWRPVLEAHPRLCLDFAHFGAQYSHPIGRTRSLGQALGLPTEWRDAIVELMGEYPGVYTDISFNGTEASYYEGLIGLLSGLPKAMGELVSSRILFGSDFMVNLTKIRSYADYYRVFADSNLPDEWKRRLCHDNPKRFLTGD